MKDQPSYLNKLLDRKLISDETLTFLQSSEQKNIMNKPKKVDKRGKQKIEYSVPKLNKNFPDIDHIAFIQHAFGVSVLQLMQISDVRLKALKNKATAFFNQASLLKLSTDKALELSQWIGALRRDGLISQKDRNDLLENVKIADTLLQNDVSPAFYRDDHKQIQVLLQYGFTMKDLMELTRKPKTLSKNLHHLTLFFIKKNNIHDVIGAPMEIKKRLPFTSPLKKLINLGCLQSELAPLAIQKPDLLLLISKQINSFINPRRRFPQHSPCKSINYIFEIASTDYILLEPFLTFLKKNPYEKPETLEAIKDAYINDSHLLALISIENINARVKQAVITTYITFIALGIPTAEIDFEKIKDFFRLNTSKSNIEQHIIHLNTICTNLKRLINDEWLELEAFIKTLHTLPKALHLRLSDIENTIHTLSMGITWEILCLSEALPTLPIPEDVPSYFNTEDGTELFTKLIEMGLTKNEITQSIKSLPNISSSPAFLKKNHHNFVILLMQAGMAIPKVWQLFSDSDHPLLTTSSHSPFCLSDAKLTLVLIKAGVFSQDYDNFEFGTRLKYLFALNKPHSFFSFLKHSRDFLEEIIAFILDKKLDPLICFEIWFDLTVDCPSSGLNSLSACAKSVKSLKDVMLSFKGVKSYLGHWISENDFFAITVVKEIALLLSFGITFAQLKELEKPFHQEISTILKSIGIALLHFVSSGYSFKSLLECAKKSAASAYQALFHYGHPKHIHDSFGSKSTGTNNKKSRRSKKLTPLQLCYKNSLKWLQHLASLSPDPSIRANLSSGQLEAISVALHIDVQYFEDYFIITEQKMPQEKFKDLIKRITERRKEPKVKINQKNMAPIFLKQRLPGIAHVVTTFLSAEDLLVTYRVQRESMAQKSHSSSDYAMAPATGGASK